MRFFKRAQKEPEKPKRTIGFHTPQTEPSNDQNDQYAKKVKKDYMEKLQIDIPGVEDVHLHKVSFMIKLNENTVDRSMFDKLGEGEVRAIEKYLEQLASNIKVTLKFPHIIVDKIETKTTLQGKAYVKLHEEVFEAFIDKMALILQAKKLSDLANMGKE